jgi:hypothetical protein
MIAAMENHLNKNLRYSFQEIVKYLDYINSLGVVDGVTGKAEPTVDGYSCETIEKIYNYL